MTALEFSDEFDILYNNIKSQSAPGLDAYEKSVFLSLAQEEIVEKAYKGQNLQNESFEETEFQRRVLDKLIKHEVLTVPVDLPTKKLNTNSVFFELPADVLYITFEEVNVTKQDCPAISLSVIPMRQDEYMAQIDNPFRAPKVSKRSSNAWRLDYTNNNKQVAEIVIPSDTTVQDYTVRYIKRPLPIIVDNIAPLGVTVQGLSTVTQCELNPMVHRHILNRAVELAKIHYEATDANSILQNNRIQI